MFDKEADTDKTSKDGQDSLLTESPAASSAEESAHAEEPAGEPTVRTPFYGFDPQGQDFVVQIDVRHGYLAILGFLEEAKDFLKAHVAMQRMEAEKKKLITPKQKGRSGIYNLFKGK